MKKYLWIFILALLLAIPTGSLAGTEYNSMFTHCTGSQDRSAGSAQVLTLNCTALRVTFLASVLVHSDTSANDVISVYYIPKFLSDYDTLLYTNTWSSETDFMWIPDGRMLMRPGDIIRVTVSDAGDSGIVFATIALEEPTWTR